MSAPVQNEQTTEEQKATESMESQASADEQESLWDLSGEITITAWNSSYTAIVEGADSFYGKHPEAKITVEQVADNTKLFTQLTTGTGVPDIMQFQNRVT